MIDLTEIKYRTVVVDAAGKEYTITEYIQDLGWEENKNELSSRLSFTSRNEKSPKGYLSSLIKPGCLVAVFASGGGGKDTEVARGYVATWNPVKRNSEQTFRATAYDELYNLQKSQDNFFFSSGIKTKSAIQRVLKKWKIPLGAYKGPDKKHGKKRFTNAYLSDVLLELLDDAVKKGGEKCSIRASKGKVTVIPRGSNDPVYVFSADNTKSISRSTSTANLVTRVKVIGKSKKNTKVEAIANGLTKYGLRQQIYTRGSDESLADAKSAAKQILNEKGKIEREVTIQSPDVPWIKKGDRVYVQAGLNKYYYVLGIQHNADSHSMTMDLEAAETEEVSKNKKTTKKEHRVGDVVNFKGGKHYVSSYKGAKGYPAKAGNAKITKINSSGKHPWHLIHTGSKSNVYGWVDNGTFD